MGLDGNEIEQCLRAAGARWNLPEQRVTAEMQGIGSALEVPARETKQWREFVGLGLYCNAGISEAIKLVEELWIENLPMRISHMKLDQTVVDDVVQVVREKFLMGGKDGVPVLAKYAVQGNPDGLAVLLATREAISRIRKDKRFVFDDGHFADKLMEREGLGEALAKEEAKLLFRKAFRAAVEKMPLGDRNLLRASLVGNIDRKTLAAMQGIHPATLRRQFATIRESLLRGTRQAMKTDHGISQDAFESLMGFIGGSLDASWSVILGRDEQS